ncbi:hypothetical protein PHLGIDRAFT_27649 [Phlebiopsis gigantea 11061_1 CR5-6]|uniref:3-ketoacyl-CoA thiolase n=1 Tax=Phlebiopsis gigantea (strain 11061_1 CR5-6) TaxID=745531 RepID=A0A0C3P2D3_PHLG1|nr:hypothetical protein PHLGIDRAFT_27649 [Phlebiopsis gigantea 11061_1 CR5-6]
MDRIKQVASHLTHGSSGGLAALERKSPEDVVITMAVRSPLCKAKKGGFKDATSEELLLEMFKQSIARSAIDPALIGDITVGTVLTPNGAYEARAAAMAAGIPETTPVQVINRWCSSGLMALTDIANKVRCGQIEVGLAVGMESMSSNPDFGWKPRSEALQKTAAGQVCAMPMGWTSENVAFDYNISREEMDEFAALSYQRAERAQKAGFFEAEIVPFTVPVVDPKTGEHSTKVVTKDDGIRYGTTKESLGKIRPAFPQWAPGQTTGGNASQITDGAAAVLLMKRSKAEQLGLKIIGKHVTTAVTGVPPRVMGVGPAFAIPMALKFAGITKDDVDLFEINEAFASQYVYSLKALGLDKEKVNVNGGAIAFGHPLDNELSRRNGKVLVTSMCIGTGMGAAAVFVRE